MRILNCMAMNSATKQQNCEENVTKGNFTESTTKNCIALITVTGYVQNYLKRTNKHRYKQIHQGRMSSLKSSHFIVRVGGNLSMGDKLM